MTLGRHLFGFKRKYYVKKKRKMDVTVTQVSLIDPTSFKILFWRLGVYSRRCILKGEPMGSWSYFVSRCCLGHSLQLYFSCTSTHLALRLQPPAKSDALPATFRRGQKTRRSRGEGRSRKKETWQPNQRYTIVKHKRK